MKLEKTFANFCGIKTGKENTFYSQNISLATFGRKKKIRSKSWNLFAENKFSKSEMPEDWSFDATETEIMVLNNKPRKFFENKNNNSGVEQNYLHRYRLIIYLASIDEIPLEYQIFNNYHISFTIFDQTIKYKLNFEEGMNSSKGFTLFLNKIQVFYFYCSDKEQIRKFLQKEQVFTFLKKYYEIT